MTDEAEPTPVPPEPPPDSSPDSPADPAAPDAEAPGPAAGEPGVVGGDDVEEEVLEEPVAIPGEQIEWQPVVTGEQIEWQPVVPEGEAEAEWAAQEGYPDWEEPSLTDDGAGTDEGAEWDPGTDDSPAPVAGNGAGGASRHPAGAAGARRAGAARPGARQPRTPPPDPAERHEAVAPKAKRQVIVLSVLTVVVVLVAVFGFVLSRGATKKGAQGTPTPSTSSRPPTTLPASELVPFRDEQNGFTLSYPKAWQRLVPPVADIRLVLQAGDYDGFQVRVFPIQTPATKENIGNLKAVTDAIVLGDGQNKLIQEQLVTLNGKLTYYYLYTFQDQVTGQQGLHAHYFVFEGHRMFALVFQTVPADEFTKQAGVFDQVAESFVVEPENPNTTTPAPAPTSTPSTTAG